PLQALTPWHCTEPSDLAKAVKGAAAENSRRRPRQRGHLFRSWSCSFLSFQSGDRDLGGLRSAPSVGHAPDVRTDGRAGYDFSSYFSFCFSFRFSSRGEPLLAANANRARTRSTTRARLNQAPSSMRG